MPHPLSSSGRVSATRPARAGRPARAFFVSARRRLRKPAGRANRSLHRVELGLWATGALLVTAAVGMKADAGLYQWRAEQRLAELSVAALPRTEQARLKLSEGTPLARLEIPRLGVDAVVAEGVGDVVLSRAVGHVPASARPGETGNIALAAHRDTFFRPLENIRVGDLIRLAGPTGSEDFLVERLTVVAPDAVDVIADAGYPALTLVTCYPFRWVGAAPERFIVRARRIEAEARPAAAPLAATPAPPRSRG